MSNIFPEKQSGGNISYVSKHAQSVGSFQLLSHGLAGARSRDQTATQSRQIIAAIAHITGIAETILTLHEACVKYSYMFVF